MEQWFPDAPHVLAFIGMTLFALLVILLVVGGMGRISNRKAAELAHLRLKRIIKDVNDDRLTAEDKPVFHDALATHLVTSYLTTRNGVPHLIYFYTPYAEQQRRANLYPAPRAISALTQV